MGLASFSAEWLRPLDAGWPARGNVAAAEGSSGHFENYLAEMRSARRNARLEQSEPAIESKPPVDDEPAEHSDEPVAQSPDSDQQPIVPSAAQVTIEVAAPVEVPPASTEGPTSFTSIEAAGVPAEDTSAGPATAQPQGGARPVESVASSRVPPTPTLPTVPETEAVPAAVASSIDTDTATSPGASVVAGTDARRAALPAETVQSRAAAANENMPVDPAERSSEESSSDENPLPEPRSQRRAPTSDSGAAEAEAGDMEPVRPAKTDDGRAQAVRGVVKVETIHEQKVKDSIAARREGDAAAQREGSPDSSSRGGPGAVNRDGRPEQHSAGRWSGGLQHREGAGFMVGNGVWTGAAAGDRGDPTAARSAQPVADAGRGAAGSLDALTTLPAQRECGAAASARRSASAVAPPGLGGAAGPTAGDFGSLNGVGRTLGDLLTGGLTGPRGPAAAARVLGATAAGPGRFQMTVQLEPPELGQVWLQIRMQQQAVALHVDVENRAVAKLIQSRMSELHDALAVQGIRVERTDVVVRSPSNGDAGLKQQNGGPGGDPGRAMSDAPGGGTGGGDCGGPPERGAGDGGRDGAVDELWTAGPNGKSEELIPEIARWSEASLDVMA